MNAPISPKARRLKQLPILTAAQEARLLDIAARCPKLRGSRATHRALGRRGLVVFAGHSYMLTAAGLFVLAAIRERGRI